MFSDVTYLQTFDTDKLHVPIQQMFESPPKKKRERLLSQRFINTIEVSEVVHERPFTTLFSQRDQISIASTAISSPKAQRVFMHKRMKSF